MNKERGRPRSFDKDAMLDLAMQVFWRSGFLGASFSELTEVTGLSKPSLYAAFGDKESLYLQALQRYLTLRLPPHAAVLENEADGRKAIGRFLRSMAGMYCDPGLPGGCLVINGVSECGSPYTPPTVDAALREAVQMCEGLLLQRLQRAQREGQIPRSARAKKLALYFTSVLAGISALAKTGTTRAKLDHVIETAMSAWPE